MRLQRGYLQPAEIHVSARVQPLENLVRVLFHSILDVHLASARIFLLAGERQVIPVGRFVRVLLFLATNSDASFEDMLREKKSPSHGMPTHATPQHAAGCVRSQRTLRFRGRAGACVSRILIGKQNDRPQSCAVTEGTFAPA